MSAATPDSAPPDVSALMEAVQRLIRESGGALPTVAEEEAAVAARLESLLLESGMRPDMLGEMLDEGGRWNLTHDYPLQGHRAGLAGRAVAWLKSVLRRCGVALGNPLVYRQAEINSYLRIVLHHLLLEQVRTQRKVAHLERVLQNCGGPSENELRTSALDRIDRLVADPEDQ